MRTYRLLCGTYHKNQTYGQLHAYLKQEQYSVTVTMFWVEEINDFYQNHKHLEFEEIYDSILKTPKFSDKHYIKQFYSNDVLETSEARAVYIRPERT